MTQQAYIPARGLRGKFGRLAARLFERDPIRIAPDRFVVSFTFDDFPRSAVENGLPELEKRGWRGTWYAAAGFAGQRNHHGALLEPDDLAQLARSGHEIGCHTHNHIDLGQAPADRVYQEIDDNRISLANMGHAQSLTAFAYPYGESSPRTKRVLSGQFETLRGVRPGINRSGDDRHLLKSVGIDGGPEGIQRVLDFIAEGRETPGWLILYAHDIQDKPTEWGCTPADFRRVCEVVDDSGASVLPVTDAYRSLVRS
ncbi:polysaccharide deacetylase family protein [Hyphobacterium sp. HN65]|uniref:Chitooligosaccharide deacetylase n=1 Tax=Hyphobacterium lacteum TaxID=3116575 RepID=A0ABU7LMJ1_9PROT|nr:polysaccharide deacetylase family protein [Hyphobacterium sp. HN65]MEE2525102.1 polysaccharide deacetylase family protein [Hyphobacterium sp. HN65]